MSGPHIIYHGPGLRGANTRIEICHDRAKTTIWMQLTNAVFLVNGSQAPSFVTVLIGAIRVGHRWVPIDPGTAARCRDVTTAVHAANSDFTTRFQKAVFENWRVFNSSQAKNWAKGTTFGTSMTNASFVLKALKTGFDAIGEASPTYSGLRRADFTVQDVIDYLNARSQKGGATLADGALLDFDELAPAPAFAPPHKEDSAVANDRRAIPRIDSDKSATHSKNFAYAAETVRFAARRVISYGFRGDSRPPSLIKNAGGFLPNYTRPDHIATQVDKAQDQALNLEHFVTNQTYGGYLSLSKSTAIAKAFATNLSGARNPGWVYACFAEGGIELPMKNPKDSSLTWVKYYEQEISVPGMIDWDDIVGCRYVNDQGLFQGNVYIKNDFAREDKTASVQVWELLSGKSQNV